MGFNKRIIQKEIVLKTPEEQIKRLFTGDMLIMDYWSENFFELFLKGYKKEEIIKKLNENNGSGRI